MWILGRAMWEEKMYVQDHSKYNKPQGLNEKRYFIFHLFIFNCAFLIFLLFYFVKYKGLEAHLLGKKTKTNPVTGLLISSSSFLWALGIWKETKLWKKQKTKNLPSLLSVQVVIIRKERHDLLHIFSCSPAQYRPPSCESLGQNAGNCQVEGVFNTSLTLREVKP